MTREWQQKTVDVVFSRCLLLFAVLGDFRTWKEKNEKLLKKLFFSRRPKPPITSLFSCSSFPDYFISRFNLKNFKNYHRRSMLFFYLIYFFFFDISRFFRLWKYQRAKKKIVYLFYFPWKRLKIFI